MLESQQKGGRDGAIPGFHWIASLATGEFGAK